MLSAEIICLNPECRRVILTHKGTSRKIKDAEKPARGQGTYRVSCPQCGTAHRVTVELDAETKP